jgi:hypothetical protein
MEKWVHAEIQVMMDPDDVSQELKIKGSIPITNI